MVVPLDQYFVAALYRTVTWRCAAQHLRMISPSAVPVVYRITSESSIRYRLVSVQLGL